MDLHQKKTRYQGDSMSTKLFSKVDKSSKGNYYTNGKDMEGNSVGGHPYCITPKHLQYNPDSMYLGEPQILEMEKSHGNMCGYKCGHPYKDHKMEKALFVLCKKPMFVKSKDINNPKTKATKELHQFLLKLKKKYSKKYPGFAFVKEDGKTPAQEFP